LLYFLECDLVCNDVGCLTLRLFPAKLGERTFPSGLACSWIDRWLFYSRRERREQARKFRVCLCYTLSVKPGCEFPV